MNSFQWIQIYEFDTMDSYIWIHILINSYAYEFINEFRISTIEFIYMNSCTHQFIWLFPSSSMKSYRLWIHKIMSYMNSYVFWIHDKLLLHVTTHLCYEASEQDRHVHGQQHGAIKRVRKGDRGKGRMGGREGAAGREWGREKHKIYFDIATAQRKHEALAMHVASSQMMVSLFKSKLCNGLHQLPNEGTIIPTYCSRFCLGQYSSLAEHRLLPI